MKLTLADTVLAEIANYPELKFTNHELASRLNRRVESVRRMTRELRDAHRIVGSGPFYSGDVAVYSALV